MSGVPIQVADTGAAGQIGYSLLFRLASGQTLVAHAFGSAAVARALMRDAARRHR